LFYAFSADDAAERGDLGRSVLATSLNEAGFRAGPSGWLKKIT